MVHRPRQFKDIGILPAFLDYYTILPRSIAANDDSLRDVVSLDKRISRNLQRSLERGAGHDKKVGGLLGYDETAPVVNMCKISRPNSRPPVSGVQ